MGYTRVVIVGGGFAGLNAAKHLRKTKLDVVLVDKSNHHLFQPLLYQVATAALSPAEIAYPIREIFRKQPNVMVVMGMVSSIHKEKKLLELANGDLIGYDYLILAPGARHSYFGQNHWEPFAPGLKTISDALNIREKILLSFEIAERLDSIKEAAKYLNFVVIGGGPTGVEMAGSIAEIARTTLLENFRRIRPEKSRVFLIEALPHILPSYPQKLSDEAKKDLEHLGVRVITGKKVTKISDEGVEMDGEFLESKNVIWAAGNQGAPLLATLGTPLDRQGRVMVEPDLSIPGYPEIFVLGDAAHLKGKDGLPLPGIAPVAIQQGKYVAKLLKNLNNSSPRKPFTYRDKGSMATIGKGKAIAQVGKIEFGGLLAWLAWGAIHIFYLIGFRSRIRVMIEWLVVFATGQRGVRLIRGEVDSSLPHHHSLEKPKWLYKILSLSSWQGSQNTQNLLLSEQDTAFIHLAEKHQVEKVVTKFWENKGPFVILKIDPAQLKGSLVHETNPGGTLKYFHLYNGSIPLNSVVSAMTIESMENFCPAEFIE